MRGRHRWVMLLATVFALLSATMFATPASAGQTYSYTASWLGYSYSLTIVANVTVAAYPDARFVGQVTNFQTTSHKASCLNGLAINVYTAPAEFPGAYVVNDNSQGAVCFLGTWTFPIYSYTASWLNYPSSSLMLIANTCVECFSDAGVVGSVSNFQTQDAHFSCLDGQSLNVYAAPNEFPGQYVVRVLAAATCTPYADTWTFPIYSYTASWLNYPSSSLKLIANTCVECFNDASVVGSVSNFQTQDAHFSCLDGQSLNVYSAPNEFPGLHIVRVVGGAMCTAYGETWTFPIFTYSGSWNGAGYQLTLLPNVEVQTLSDASLITYQNNCGGSGQPGCGSPVQLQNFQTNDPNFACLNGRSINVWMAQNEFPGKHIGHVVGGTICTAYGITWTFVPNTHYTITLKSFIPQAQLWDPGTSSLCALLLFGALGAVTVDTCPYLTYSSENTVFGTGTGDPGVPGCYTPFDPLDTTVSGVFAGDGHSGYNGSFRTQTVVNFDWNPVTRTISNYDTTQQHGTSSVTLNYFWFGGHVGGPCTVTSTDGIRYVSSSASGASFSTGTSGWDPFVPGETNSFNCVTFYLASCGPYNDVIDATLRGSFNADGTLTLPWETDWYPSYGVQVWANSSYDAPQYQQTVLDESGVNTMGVIGSTYVGYALKYYNAASGACTPTPAPGGLIISMNYCPTGSATLNPAP